MVFLYLQYFAILILNPQVFKKIQCSRINKTKNYGDLEMIPPQTHTHTTTTTWFQAVLREETKVHGAGHQSDAVGEISWSNCIYTRNRQSSGAEVQ